MKWDQIKHLKISESEVQLFITVSKNANLRIKTERERIQIWDSLADFGRAWKWVNYSQVPPSYFYFSQTYILVRTYKYPIYLSCKTYNMGIVLYTYHIQVIFRVEVYSGYSTSMRCPYVSHQLWCWPTQLLIKRTVCKKLVQDLSLSTSF